MTIRQRLKEIALDQYGFVTTDDARRLGVAPVELPKIAARGGLQRVGHGLYRFDDLVPTRYDSFQEAVLSVGASDACLVGTAVLALHDLAQVNPAALRVNTKKRVRRRPRPDVVITHENIDAADRTTYFGIPSTTVAAAIRAARSEVMASRLQMAIDDARRMGLISATDAKALRSELTDRPDT